MQEYGSRLQAPNRYAYPPDPSTSNLSLNSTIYDNREKRSVLLNETTEEPVATAKKGWTHKTLNTAFGPLNVRMFLKKKYIKWYIALIIIGVLVALMSIYHHQIVAWMEPWANKLEALPGGWAIPIGIMFVISFPPLFGHEIVAVLCGVVWGLWVGFGIVAAGTLIGEIGNFYAFKWCLTARADKLAKTDLNYACMVRTVEEGGFIIAFIARLSAIPGHLTTGVFATCNMSFFTFFAATVLTLPKQLQVVYLGTIFDQEEDKKSTASKIVTNTVLVLSFVITIVAAWYIYKKMAKFRPIVEAEWAERARTDAAFDSTPSIVEVESQRAPLASGYRQQDNELPRDNVLRYQQPQSRSDFSLNETSYRDPFREQSHSQQQTLGKPQLDLRQSNHPYAQSPIRSQPDYENSSYQKPRQAPSPPQSRRQQAEYSQRPELQPYRPDFQQQQPDYNRTDLNARAQAHQHASNPPYQYQQQSRSPSTSRQPISQSYTPPAQSAPIFEAGPRQDLEYASNYILPSPPPSPRPVGHR